MFHLLVKGDTWPRATVSFDPDRVINVRECTDAAIVEQFKPKGVLDSARIARLPALFVSEIGGPGKQQARVGDIIRARLVGGEVTIDYTFDSDIPPIPNSTLKKLSTDLSIQIHRPHWELNHSHWSIKDVDLFRVLFRNQAPARLSPKVFTLDDLEEVDDRLISVMMPFDILLTRYIPRSEAQPKLSISDVLARTRSGRSPQSFKTLWLSSSDRAW